MTTYPPQVYTDRYGLAPQQVLDVYVPESPSSVAIMMIHGGFWRDEKNPGSLASPCQEIRRHGIVAASAGYRTSAYVSHWTDAVADVANAARQLIEVAKVPLEKVILVGHSAGGHLALMAARQLEWLGAVVALAPICDLQRAVEDNLGDGAVNEFVGFQESELRAASPRHLPPPECDVTLVHGTADQAVPLSQSTEYVDYLRQRQARVRFRVVEQARHMHLVKPERPAWQTVIDELSRTVKDIQE